MACAAALWLGVIVGDPPVACVVRSATAARSGCSVADSIRTAISCARSRIVAGSGLLTTCSVGSPSVLMTSPTSVLWVSALSAPLPDHDNGASPPPNRQAKGSLPFPIWQVVDWHRPSARPRRLRRPRLLVGESGGSPLPSAPVRPGRAGTWRSSFHASRASVTATAATWTVTLPWGTRSTEAESTRKLMRAETAASGMLFYDVSPGQAAKMGRRAVISNGSGASALIPPLIPSKCSIVNVPGTEPRSLIATAWLPWPPGRVLRTSREAMQGGSFGR